MRVAVVGATGNVGLALLRSLEREPAVDSVIGIARRKPEIELAKVMWREADVTSAGFARQLADADVVVHLAWLIQPSRNERKLRAVNVEGSMGVFRAVAEAGVPALVYASSVGAYSPGPKDRLVDEGWPTAGIPSSFYSRHKAEVEAALDRFEADHPEIRVVRLRPGLIFQRDAASEIRRLFAGPLLPGLLLRRSLIPIVPDLPELRFQAVHADDVADAYRLAIVRKPRGPFNIAADPVLDTARLASLLGARRVRVPPRLLRGSAAATWRLRLQPTPPGWIDLALQTPLMDTGRAREELGWEPRYSSARALGDLLAGLRQGAGASTPPLEPGGAGAARSREFLTGVGSR